MAVWSVQARHKGATTTRSAPRDYKHERMRACVVSYFKFLREPRNHLFMSSLFLNVDTKLNNYFFKYHAGQTKSFCRLNLNLSLQHDLSFVSFLQLLYIVVIQKFKEQNKTTSLLWEFPHLWNERMESEWLLKLLPVLTYKSTKTEVP